MQSAMQGYCIVLYSSLRLSLMNSIITTASSVVTPLRGIVIKPTQVNTNRLPTVNIPLTNGPNFTVSKATTASMKMEYNIPAFFSTITSGPYILSCCRYTCENPEK